MGIGGIGGFGGVIGPLSSEALILSGGEHHIIMLLDRPFPSPGKTFSFLVPTLARLVYPPEVFAEDLRGPQAIIVVPTMELGVQVSTERLSFWQWKVRFNS